MCNQTVPHKNNQCTNCASFIIIIIIISNLHRKTDHHHSQPTAFAAANKFVKIAEANKTQGLLDQTSPNFCQM